jgi:hypothetical protein
MDKILHGIVFFLFWPGRFIKHEFLGAFVNILWLIFLLYLLYLVG